jgi:hypothetical protein
MNLHSLLLASHLQISTRLRPKDVYHGLNEHGDERAAHSARGDDVDHARLERARRE